MKFWYRYMVGMDIITFTINNFTFVISYFAFACLG